MTAAFNAAVAWNNIAASGLATITSITAAPTMPASTLQQEDILRNWRGAGGAGVLESVYFDLGAVQSLTNWTVGLFNVNLAASDTTRLRLSVADPTCGTNTYDSTSATGRVDPDYKSLIFLATPASAPRYGRIDLTRAAGNPEAGFIFVGDRTQFPYNYIYGAQITTVDPSIPKKTRGGQTKIMLRPKFRRAEFSFDAVPDSQRWSIIEQIDIDNGTRLPVLFILDPSSTNLGRDSIFGLLEVSPVTTVPGFISGARVYSKSYKIDQRL